MTSHELQKQLNLTVFHQGDDRPVVTGYCCDLLSWVMGKAPADCAWVTVMNNNNVAAVAVLCDAACIILAQGAKPDANLQKRAELEGLNLYGSELDAYPLAIAMGQLLKEA
ncbi:MAG: hypothetical protein E7223_07345 [Clostridiales bacterium]|nr:hypothetical protein [Clostridiales bacterium]